MGVKVPAKMTDLLLLLLCACQSSCLQPLQLCLLVSYLLLSGLLGLRGTTYSLLLADSSSARAMHSLQHTVSAGLCSAPRPLELFRLEQTTCVSYSGSSLVGAHASAVPARVCQIFYSLLKNKHQSFFTSKRIVFLLIITAVLVNMPPVVVLAQQFSLLPGELSGISRPHNWMHCTSAPTSVCST